MKGGKPPLPPPPPQVCGGEGEHAGVFPKSSLVGIVRANVHGHDAVAFNIEDGPQIAFDVHGMNGSSVMSGKAVNLVRTETRVKRGLLKNPPKRTVRIPFDWASGRKGSPKSSPLA